MAELYDAATGRPSIDPEAALRLMLAGFLLGFVHDRRLMVLRPRPARDAARPFEPDAHPPALGWPSASAGSLSAPYRPGGCCHTWRQVADQLRPRWLQLAALMDESEHEVLGYMAFPAQHRAKRHSPHPLERLKKEVERRADVVGIFANEPAIVCLIGAVLLERTDEWQLSTATCSLWPWPNSDRRPSIPSRS